MKYEGTGIIDSNGNAVITNRHLLEQWFADNRGKPFSCVFKIATERHSDRVRRYYFAEVVSKFQIAFKGLGYSLTKEETHDFIKQYSPIMIEEIELNGKFFKKYRSITKLSNAEFKEYIADLQQFAAEHLSLIINDPLPPDAEAH